MTLEISFLFSLFSFLQGAQETILAICGSPGFFCPGLHELHCFLKRIILARHFLCRAKHHIVLSGDAFLRSIGAQALRGGLAKNYF